MSTTIAAILRAAADDQITGGEPGWAASLVTSVALGVGGAVTVWVGRRQANGTLKRNDLAGFRTKTTMASDATWKAAHDTTANLTTWAGIISLVGGALLLTNPSGSLWIATVAITVVLVLGLIVFAGFKAQHAAKHVLHAETHTPES